MASVSVSSPMDEYVTTTAAVANVRLSRIALKQGGPKSAQVCFVQRY